MPPLSEPLSIAIASRQDTAPLLNVKDQFLIQSRNTVSGVTYTIVIRVMDPETGMDQEISLGPYKTTNSTAALEQLFTGPLSVSGYLKAVSVLFGPGSASVVRGQTYVDLWLCSGGQANPIELAGDYIFTDHSPSWFAGGGGTGVVNPESGQGVIRDVSVSNPAAGASLHVKVTTNRKWRLISARVRLVTSSQAATRVINVTEDAATTAIYPDISVTASTTIEFMINGSAAPTLRTSTASFTPTVSTYLTYVIDFNQGPWASQDSSSFIDFYTGSIQTNDQYSVLGLIVEEWLTW